MFISITKVVMTRSKSILFFSLKKKNRFASCHYLCNQATSPIKTEGMCEFQPSLMKEEYYWLKLGVDKGGLTQNDLYDTICMTLHRFLYDSTNLNM